MNYLPKLLNITKSLGHIVLINQIKTPLKADLQKSLSQINEKTLKSRLIEISKINYDSRLEKINIKTLILNAKKDLIVPRKTAKLLNKIKKEQTHWINSPHFLLQTQSELSAEILKNFSYNLKNDKNYI